MVKRYLLFLALLSLPILVCSVRRPACLPWLLVAVTGAWWAVSPVSYPRWVLRGMARALPLAGVESLALWWLGR